MRRDIGPEDLSQQALARIHPALTLTKLGDLANPPLHRAQMSRLRNGHSATPATWLRVEGAINTARQYFSVEQEEPRRGGRRRKVGAA